MRFLAAIYCIILLGFGYQTQAQKKSYTSFFKYDASKIQVGTVYHYTKSNTDGSHPIRVSVYVKSKTELEVCKIEEGLIDAALIKATMNWETFSANHLEAYVYNNDSTVHRATMTTQNNTFKLIIGKKEESHLIPYFPMHIYNFDLVSFNFMFRHLKNPKKDFKVAIFDPTFAEGGTMMACKGDMNVHFLQEEVFHKVPCRKYQLTGSGIENTVGYIWVNKEKGHIENIEVPWRDNPNWNSFKFELVSIEQMTPTAWETYRYAPFRK